MGARIDRESGERASASARPGPAACGGVIGDAEPRPEAVVNELLDAHPLRRGERTVAERDGGAVGEDCRRHVFGVPGRVRSDLLLLGRRRRQEPLSRCLEPPLAERLDPRCR